MRDTVSGEGVEAVSVGVEEKVSECMGGEKKQEDKTTKTTTTHERTRERKPV